MPRCWVVMQAHHAEALEFRPATEADQPAIVDICKTSITTTYGVFMNPERMRPWVDGQEVENYVARMWPRMTVAVDDGVNPVQRSPGTHDVPIVGPPESQELTAKVEPIPALGAGRLSSLHDGFPA